MKFSVKDLFSKCDQVRWGFGRINWKNPQWKTSFFVQLIKKAPQMPFESCETCVTCVTKKVKFF